MKRKNKQTKNFPLETAFVATQKFEYVAYIFVCFNIFSTSLLIFFFDPSVVQTCAV